VNEPELTDGLKASLGSHLAPRQVASVVQRLRLQGFDDDAVVKLIVDNEIGRDAADAEGFVRSVLADCDKRERRHPVLERKDWSQTAFKFTQAGNPTLLCYSDDFLEWNGGVYETIPDSTIRSEVRKFLSSAVVKSFDRDKKTVVAEPFNPATGDVNETVNALKDFRHFSPTVRLPTWLDYDGPQPTASECIAFPNGILHVPTGEFIPRTSAFLNRNRLEFAGYLLTSDTSYQKALFLLGPRRSGKGLISRIIRNLVGNSNSVSTSLNSLGGEFGLAPLIARLFALIGETKFGSKVDRTEVTRRLLSIIGEDGVDINRKNKDYWDGVMLLVRFMFLGNEVPRFDDSAGAMAARLIILKMTASFDGKEDSTLEGRLEAELPGILLWALKGLRRLRDRGRFVEPKSSSDAKRLVRELASPVSVFVAECCVLEPEAHCTRDDLYRAYRRHSEAVGVKFPVPQNGFFAELEAAFQEHIKLFRTKVAGEAGKVDRPRMYRGIRLARDSSHSEIEGVPF
jgi:putative DNA primase/helicase